MTMPIHSGAMLELVKLLNCSRFHQLVEKDGKWELWFCGDDFGKTPEESQAVTALDAFDNYFLSHSYGEVVVGDQDAILGFKFGADYDDLNVVSQLARLLNVGNLLQDSYTDAINLVMKPCGDIIQIDLEAISYGHDTEQGEPIPFFRVVSQFDYHPSENKLTARPVQPKFDDAPPWRKTRTVRNSR